MAGNPMESLELIQESGTIFLAAKTWPLGSMGLVVKPFLKIKNGHFVCSSKAVTNFYPPPATCCLFATFIL
jgi:hypothetical protein